MDHVKVTNKHLSSVCLLIKGKKKKKNLTKKEIKERIMNKMRAYLKKKKKKVY